MRAAPILLAQLTALGRVGRVACDRAYSSRPWRRAIEAAGAEPCIPANKTHPPAPYDHKACARRHRVENPWGRPKEWRAIATRCDKTAASFHGALHIAAAMDWLPNRA